ncbi:MAG: PAT family beta-lactamase induction signal transducer AmpG [Saprospiraceae bacterium]|jgi:PAT family beta-lactamase induction signal transducer AmpG
MLFLGFSAGLPILLIFSSLSIWLREAEVSRSAVTYFSWAALGYSFKFVWAPLVDRLQIPLLGAWLGRRRSWILLSQLAVIGSILWMSSVDPTSGEGALSAMALAAVALGFSSATQDIVIDAYRIESAHIDLQALMSSTYIAGYRIGMLVAGAGALYLADYFGTSMEQYQYSAWQFAYMGMAGFMFIGVACTLTIEEPHAPTISKIDLNISELLRFLFLFVCIVIGFVTAYIFTGQFSSGAKDYLTELFSNKHLSGFLVSISRLAAALGVAFAAAWLLKKSNIVDEETLETTYLAPVKDFFSRYGLKTAWLLLALISLYRISDIVLGVISNVFYTDMGYEKAQIATIVKSFGLGMTLVGGFLGGLLAIRFGVMRILLLGAVLGAASNLLFMLLAGHNEPSHWGLVGVIAADNLAAGLASAAFIAFLSALTNIKFTAIQYAIFSSLMTLIPKILGGYSGSMVDAIGYPSFFMVSAILGLPAIFLILLARKKLNLSLPK